MLNIIVDSCVWISFYDSEDSNHQRAIQDLTKLQEQDNEVWVTVHIIDEVCNILLKRGQRRQLQDFVDLLQEQKIHIFDLEQVEPIKQESQASDSKLQAGLNQQVLQQLIKQKQSKISFTDWHAMLLVEREILPYGAVLSYDRHFRRLDEQYCWPSINLNAADLGKAAN
jgi:predicted nucleic acid-binding protein